MPTPTCERQLYTSCFLCGYTLWYTDLYGQRVNTLRYVLVDNAFYRSFYRPSLPPEHVPDTVALCINCLEHSVECFLCEPGTFHHRSLGLAHPQEVRECVNCSGWYRIANVVEAAGNWLCLSCHDEVQQQCALCGDTWYTFNREHCACLDLPGHHYQPNDMKYFDKSLTPCSRPKDRTLYLGLELEVECKACDNEAVIAEVMRSKRPLYCKHDGSLNNGVEIVSMPMTYDAWLAQWDKLVGLYTTLRDMGCRSYTTDTCGIHIHASKRGYQSLGHLYRVGALIYGNKGKIIALSQRESSRLKRWASLDDVRHIRRPARTKQTALGFAPWADPSEYDWDGHRIFASLPDKLRTATGSKYSAMNMLHPHTVEYRFFRGTLYPNAILRALETIQAMRDHALGVSMPEATSWPSFARFVTENKKQFPQLHAWTNENKRDTADQFNNY